MVVDNSLVVIGYRKSNQSYGLARNALWSVYLIKVSVYDVGYGFSVSDS